MKYLTLCFVFALVASAYAGEIGLTTNIINMEPNDEDDLGRGYREDIMRGPDCIYTLVKNDRDLDGTFEEKHEIFRHKKKAFLRISHSFDSAIQITGSELPFSIEDSDQDGIRDTIRVMDNDLRTCVEKYTLDPISKHFRPADNTKRDAVIRTNKMPIETDYLKVGMPD